MSPKRSCGLVALVAVCVVGYASIAAMVLSNSEVQTQLGELFRPHINFIVAVAVLNLLAEFGLLAAVFLLAVAQLIPEEMIPLSRVARHNNRIDQVREVAA